MNTMDGRIGVFILTVENKLNASFKWSEIQSPVAFCICIPDL